MSNPEIAQERIKVWRISDLYHNAFAAIKGEGEYTVSESYWLLKLLESLLEVRRRNKSFELPAIKYQREQRL